MAAALGMKDLARDTRLFENFDTDKSGQLDTEELKAGLARLGLRQDLGFIWLPLFTVLGFCFQLCSYAVTACYSALLPRHFLQSAPDSEDPSGLMAAMDLDQDPPTLRHQTLARRPART